MSNTTSHDVTHFQDHGTILPMLIAGKTAQPATLTPLSIINEGLDQLEKLLAANLKGGVFQGLCVCVVCVGMCVWGGQGVGFTGFRGCVVALCVSAAVEHRGWAGE